MEITAIINKTIIRNIINHMFKIERENVLDWLFVVKFIVFESSIFSLNWDVVNVFCSNGRNRTPELFELDEELEPS